MYATDFRQSVAEEHYKDLLAEAANERLIQFDRCRVSPVRSGLYRLGQQMVVWGTRLQSTGARRKEVAPLFETDHLIRP